LIILLSTRALCALMDAKVARTTKPVMPVMMDWFLLTGHFVFVRRAVLTLYLPLRNLRI
jgi:hypothetical protein